MLQVVGDHRLFGGCCDCGEARVVDWFWWVRVYFVVQFVVLVMVGG
jgi:hypothetical protein